MRALWYGASALALCATGLAQEKTATPSPAPPTELAASPAPAAPAYTPVRWNEDYRYLRNTEARRDFWDQLKYIPLNDEGDIYLSLGGQVRYRYEYFEDANWGAGPQDGSGYHLLRIMPHADLHIGPNLRFFVQGKSSLEDDRAGGPRPIDEDKLDLQQAFVDLRIPFEGTDSLTLRAGRQDLIYGAQRLISPLDWANTRRTFQGFKGSLSLQQHMIDAFWVRPIIVDDSSFNNDDNDTDFAGIYDTILLPNLIEKANSRWELYFLFLDRDNSSAFATEPAGDEERYTIGTRFYTNPKPWDFDLEIAYQFGDFGDGDISAWSAAAEAGYSFDARLSPRVYLGFDIASGDRDAGDSDLETFNQLFPLGHAFFGYIDAIGRQNIIDVHPGVELTLLKEQKFVRRLSLRVDYHLFWRESDEDGVYNAAGAVQRAPGGSDERYVGSELDLLLTWQIDRHTQAYFGYSHFMPGDFIDDTGPSG